MQRRICCKGTEREKDGEGEKERGALVRSARGTIWVSKFNFASERALRRTKEKEGESTR